MKTTVNLVLFWIVLAFHATGQNDSIPAGKKLSLEEKINYTRLELRSAFLMEDPAAVGLWLDSLARLEDDTYVGISWDERWLLHYWMDNYGTLLTEASQFGTEERTAQSYKVPPPADSLFELIDATMLEKQYQQFQNIRHAFLNEEEKAFSTMLLEYLLRLNGNEDEWFSKIEAFESQYPSSRFLYFLRSVKPNILKPANKGVGLSMSFLSSSWSDELDRSFKPLYGLHLDLYYWVDRWNLMTSFIFGGPKVARNISDGVEIWPKNDPTSFVNWDIQLGYDVVNQNNLRIFPALVGGMTFFGPPVPDEESEEEVPEYYDNFRFFEAHLGVSLVADVKLFKDKKNDWGLPKGSYHGLRMRVGYNWLNFEGQNPLLAGNMFYFAIGYNLFGYLEAKKRS